ncbi:Crp/Fnr family transcriptional regulator [Rhabdaerophilum sp. SD176]|uniref:Crp/Fnr family transcriptional regulator n=1 Tax=Rhabdaerophilum sp. SD176 TaxID=2983548 RepID=UPI0024DF715D|nr:Crp/Fnr family transcriptional regulator [Rhabdaerophilum sp. SD176]
MISLDALRQMAAWARDLTPEEAEKARRGIVERTYGKGNYICHQGDRFDCWGGIVSGLVKLSTVSDSGKQVSLAGLAAGAWFGEGSLLKNEPRRYDLVALRESRLMLMDLPTFNWLFEHSVGFNRFLVHQFNERLAQFIGQVENDRMLDATGRVARALASIFNPRVNPGVGTHLAITQEEIGLLSGLSRQVTNQSLKVLEHARVVQVERGGIAIRDWLDLVRFGNSGA